MDLEELSTCDQKVRIEQGRCQMLDASGKEKARLKAKLLELMCIFHPKKQRHLEAMVTEDACLLLEYEPRCNSDSGKCLAKGTRFGGGYEPAANNVAGAEKGAPMSHEEANEHRANPV